jgi:tol-pal system protein YbgF
MSRSIVVLATLLSLGLAGPAAAQNRPLSADGESEKRLQRLEEQIVDLNAQVGTIESLSRGGGGGGGGGAPVSGGGFGGGGDDAQIRALSGQLNDIMRRLERLEARLGAAPAPTDSPAYGDARPRNTERQGRSRPAEQGTGFSIGGLDDTQDEPDSALPAPPPLQQRGSAADGRNAYPNEARGGFPQDNRGGDRSGWSPDPAPLSPPVAATAPRADAGASPLRTAALSSPQAQAAYEQALAAFQQQNFRAASAGFEQFLQRYPSDPLAGAAQFWLGEAAFTSGDYRRAADLYLKTATTYPDSEKAAESLFKLGISLKRLGENDAACSTFTELGKRYPNASALLQRADTEKRRSSC